MNKAIIGKKLGMSQIFTADGIVIPVTVVEAGPCPVVQKKTQEKDGYNALQVAFGDVKEKNVSKPVMGQFKKANVAPKKVLKELPIENVEAYEIGQEINCSIFAEGDHVDVVGTSKGKGFAGAVKRWNHHIGPKAHGSGYHRGVGSMSANSSPSRVFKNKKMAGHLGNERVTVQNLTVARVDAARNLLLIKGAIPGAKGGIVVVKQSVKA
ncbi:MAG: 50S ribosomal protein L3 [Clostridiales bacterium]|nr:50S ribosomal protein L3 [Clostridiales bacterium]